ESRGEQTMLARAMGIVSRHPDTSTAARVGSPTLTDTTLVSGSDIVQRATRMAAGPPRGGEHSVTAQATGTGAPPENEPAPRSDAPIVEEAKPTDESSQANANPEVKPEGFSGAGDSKAPGPDPNELPVGSDPQPAPAPAQVNDLAQGGSSGNGGG